MVGQPGPLSCSDVLPRRGRKEVRECWVSYSLCRKCFFSYLRLAIGVRSYTASFRASLREPTVRARSPLRAHESRWPLSRPSLPLAQGGCETWVPHPELESL